VLILKTEYLSCYFIDFDETNVVEFKIRCSFYTRASAENFPGGRRKATKKRSKISKK